eukprot:gene103-509_t
MDAVVNVTLTNPSTGEYMLFETAIKLIEPKQLGHLKLEAACRQVSKEVISISNPLKAASTFNCESTNPDIKFMLGNEVVTSFSVEPYSEQFVDIIYRPLIEGSGTAQLKITSPELGVYPYNVDWNASAPGLDVNVVFKAPFGSDRLATYRFTHWSNKPASYTATIAPAPGRSSAEAADFVVETKDIKANPATGSEGVPMEVEVRFQPSEIQERR